MNDDCINILSTALDQSITKNTSFSCQAYQIIYESVISNKIEKIIEDLKKAIDILFHHFIIEIYQNESFSLFFRYSSISNQFIHHKKILSNFFCIVERFSDNSTFSLDQELNQQFIHIFRSLTNFDELLQSFFEKLNTFHFTDFRKSYEFVDLTNTSKLIHFCYPEKEKQTVLTDNLLAEARNSAQNFIYGITDINMLEFMTSLNRYLTIEESLLNNLFYKETAETTLLSTYNIFSTEVKNTHYERLSVLVSESIKNREKSLILEYYKFLSFRSPPESSLSLLSELIHEQIKNEPTDNIINLGKAISFYDDIFNTLNNSFLTKEYNRQIVQSLHTKKKEIFKDLISFISKAANSNPDISPIRPILGKIDNKSEFELIYSRHVTRRLVPPTEKQIEREHSIVTQIQSSSLTSSYEFSKLLNLLNEASQSIEKHIGPVLICNVSVWPFQPPFPKCSYFDSICNEIQTKYSKSYPNRILTFPFDSWIVCVKDTLKNFVMSGNGVQSQIFLYLNNHEIVHKDSFAPHISSVQMTSALKSLSTKKMPLLIEKETNNEITYFSLNSNYQNKLKSFKLPTPAFVHKTAQNDLIQNRNDQIDAALTKLMKEKRLMKYNEMESEIKERLSGRFRVNSDEVKSRVNELVAREFLEMNEVENTIIYLP